MEYDCKREEKDVAKYPMGRTLTLKIKEESMANFKPGRGKLYR